MLAARQIILPCLPRRIHQRIFEAGLGPVTGYVYDVGTPGIASRHLKVMDESGFEESDCLTKARRHQILTTEMARIERQLGLSIANLLVATSRRPGKTLVNGQQTVRVSNFLEVVSALMALDIVEGPYDRASLEIGARSNYSTHYATRLGNLSAKMFHFDQLVAAHGMSIDLFCRLLEQWVAAMRRLLGIAGCTEFNLTVTLDRPSAHQRLSLLHAIGKADWASFERMLETGRAP